VSQSPERANQHGLNKATIVPYESNYSIR